MSTPIVPFGGYTGFRFLERTYDSQLETFVKSPTITRNVEYFLENAGVPETAEDLVQDRRLLEVVLGAFGLDEEIDKRALVRRILEEGVIDSTSFANRLNDTRYKDMAETIGFDQFGSLLNIESRREKVVELYKVRQFERMVGDIDVDMRLALNFDRDIAEIAGQGLSEDAGWFRVLGSEPLRTVVEGAFNLPSEFSQIDLDSQVERLKEKAREMYGGKSVEVFADAENVDDMVRRYLLNAQVKEALAAYSPGSTALTLLQGASLGSQGAGNLFASNF